MKSICALCHKDKKLHNSHIVPKFIFDWMKSTGGRYFRCTENINLRQQDGPKEKLLCGDCETIFSKFEKYFSETIFYPYIDNNENEIKYDHNNMKFLISMLWRIIVTGIPLAEKIKANNEYIPLLKEAENEWRYFLQDSGGLDNFGQVHLLCTDIIANNSKPVMNINTYMTRTVDGTVATGRKMCFVYSKFARFMIFGFLTEFTETNWINTKISDGNGILTIPQKMKDAAVGDFIVDRARNASIIYETKVSTKQKERIKKDVSTDVEWFKTDFARSLAADYFTDVNPATWQQDKIGRNDLCPCGSGLKYKKCHGAQ